MQTKHKYYLIAYGESDYNKKTTYAETIVQQHPEIKVVVIYNSNKEPSNSFYKSDKVSTIFYPSNRTIEPHLILLQFLEHSKHLAFLFSDAGVDFNSIEIEYKKLINIIKYKSTPIGLLLNTKKITKALKNKTQNANDFRQLFNSIMT